MNRLFAAIRVPKAYLGFDTGEITARSSLVSQDIRFARQIKLLQRALIQEVNRLCMIHLALIGVDPTEADFSVHTTPVSYLDEMQRAELFQTKLETAERLARIGVDLNLDRRVWLSYVFGDLLGFAKEFVERLLVSGDRPPNVDIAGGAGDPAGAASDDYESTKPSPNLLVESIASVVAGTNGDLSDQQKDSIKSMVDSYVNTTMHAKYGDMLNMQMQPDEATVERFGALPIVNKESWEIYNSTKKPNRK